MQQYRLVQQQDRLELHHNSESFKPLYIDFTSGKAKHRRIFSGKELLAKAVDYKKKQPPTVIDATAGLAKDAFVLASLGCKLIMLERSEIIFQLLANAIERAEKDPETRDIVARMQLQLGDAIQLLPGLAADVIYCDPMYPARNKSALVKKDMRILRDINGADLDCEQLLTTALACDVKRVVVKRPKSAGHLAELPPDFSYNSGKHTRFDIYCPREKLAQ